MAGAALTTWHIVTPEFPPQPGGVSDYTAQLAPALEQAGQPVRVWCHEFEGFTPAGLRRVGRELDALPSPRRLLLQWVPHGFGYRSMNVNFCRWIASRPEPLEIMVHEPGLSFGEGGMRQDALAAVHRLMIAILLRRAEQVWISIPGWEKLVRPYAFGRKIPFTWLPVPSNISVVPRIGKSTYQVGYFGQYDRRSRQVLSRILDRLPFPVLLMGRGSERVIHPRAVAAGELSAIDLSHAIQSCEILSHWYPDGVSSRRGTVMASLCHAKPVVTNQGPWTDPIWRKSGAVALASDAAGFALQVERLLRSESERANLKSRALMLYCERFKLENSIQSLISIPR